MCATFCCYMQPSSSSFFPKNSLKILLPIPNKIFFAQKMHKKKIHISQIFVILIIFSAWGENPHDFKLHRNRKHRIIIRMLNYFIAEVKKGILKKQNIFSKNETFIRIQKEFQIFYGALNFSFFEIS